MISRLLVYPSIFLCISGCSPRNSHSYPIKLSSACSLQVHSSKPLYHSVDTIQGGYTGLKNVIHIFGTKEDTSYLKVIFNMHGYDQARIRNLPELNRWLVNYKTSALPSTRIIVEDTAQVGQQTWIALKYSTREYGTVQSFATFMDNKIVEFQFTSNLLPSSYFYDTAFSLMYNIGVACNN